MDRGPPHSGPRTRQRRRTTSSRVRPHGASRPQPFPHDRADRLHHRVVDDLPHRKAAASPSEETMKVAILFGQFEGCDEQPGAVTEATKPKRKRKKKKTDVEAIGDALRALGHETTAEPIDGSRQTLARLARSDVDLFFNLVES